ncbi:MAG: FAD-dependent oxidoreductase [Verrucomicrobia bacterium]|nr:FAD-dependent oxidoreductase [Verrucomicrobiota bacterium]
MHQIRWLLLRGAGLLGLTAGLARAESADVVIYGATPSGIAAAIAAAKGGHTVLLAEPTIRIGGMTTNGLSHPDFRAFEALSGTYHELTLRTLAYYRKTYGPDSQQVKDTFRGTHAEPKVNLLLFQQLLAEHPKITVRTQWTLAGARTRGPAGNRWVQAAHFRDPAGKEHVFEGKILIDATYEGDLIAAAQVPYRVGVESRDEYGESAAPEDSSGDLQGYNFRLTMTQDPANRVMPVAPRGYRREDFAPLLDLIAAGKIKQAFGGYTDRDNVLKAQIPILPNGKRDINDVSNGFVRLSLPGDQLMWPEGDAATRQRIYDEHVLWNVGLIYFLQNDPAVPAAMREPARTWGFCRDEFVETGHLPPQLYVREARRMVGLRVFTQNDTPHAPGDARAILHRDAIAIGEYGHSSHGTRHEGSRFGGKRHGEGLGVVYAPYQIPYGTIVPKDVRNLLAPVPVSASHVGFCAIRLEPAWTSLGQAAGHAAHLALQQESPDVRALNVAQLQRLLHADRSATLYVNDVPRDSPDFPAVQWWGAAGGLHGLAPKPAGSPRGKAIQGQYSEGWLNHAADLARVLDATLASRWEALGRELGLPVEKLPKADGRTTRGDWIRAAFRAGG